MHCVSKSKKSVLLRHTALVGIVLVGVTGCSPQVARMNEQAQPVSAGSDPMMTGSVNTTSNIATVETSPMPAPVASEPAVNTGVTATSNPEKDTLFRRWKSRKAARERGERTTLFGDDSKQAAAPASERRRFRLFKDKSGTAGGGSAQVASVQQPGVDQITTQSVTKTTLAAPGQSGSSTPAVRSVQPTGQQDGGWSANGGTLIVVQEGQTLYSISRRYGIPVDALMQANNLSSPMQLNAGQQLILPTYSYSQSAPVSAPDSHKKTEPMLLGKQQASASADSQVTAPKQQEVLVEPRQAQKIIQPQPSAQPAPAKLTTASVTRPSTSPRRKPYGSVRQVSLRQTAKTPAPAKIDTPKVVAKAPAKPTTHKKGSPYIVVAGDTVWRISNKTGVSRKDLMAANGLNQESTLQIGQKLVIPDGQVTAKVAAKTPSAPKAKQPLPNAVETPKVAKSEPAKPAAPVADPTKLRWPAQGKLVSSFGDINDGRKNVGINLSVPEGTAVRSAESGTVVYVGDQIANYGNLVLIRHADGLVTAYAHNKSLLVTKGETVRRGQVIARAGSTGNVSRPQLHFEVRKGSQPVDPMDYLTAT